MLYVNYISINQGQNKQIKNLLLQSYCNQDSVALAKEKHIENTIELRVQKKHLHLWSTWTKVAKQFNEEKNCRFSKWHLDNY